MDTTNTRTIGIARISAAFWKHTDAGDSRDRGSRRSDSCGGSSTDARCRGRSDYYWGVFLDTVILAAAFANTSVAAILTNVGAPRLVLGALERGRPACGEKAVSNLKDTFCDRNLAGWVI